MRVFDFAELLVDLVPNEERRFRCRSRQQVRRQTPRNNIIYKMEIKYKHNKPALTSVEDRHNDT